MNEGLFQGAWKIGSIIGIPIKIHFSWIIVFGLITWSLSTYYFPNAAPDLPAVSYWIKGTLAALLLFTSVCVHELAHSIVARRYGLSIISITLFIFGGVAQIKGEPPRPEAEFRIAIAGPASSFLLAFFFYFLSLNTIGGVKALFAYVAQINLIIGAFNLIPGFPMDGGRVLRSVIWEKKRDFFYATRKAAGIGQKIAIFFIFFGIFSIFAGMPGGIWLMLVGWFLFTAAQASYQQAGLQQILTGVRVRNIMTRDIVTLSPSMTLANVVDDYFLKYGYGGFPVVENGTLSGILTLKEVKNTPREDWGTVKVSDILPPHDKKWEISPDEEVLKVLELMMKADKGRIIVTEKGSIVGLITRNGIARYLQVMGKQA
jgi:Zn-dependent protease